MLVGLALAAPASAATINVTTPTDGFTADGLCSLREAITDANGGAVATGCTAGDATGTDTISLPAGTYNFASNTSEDANAAGDLDITSDVALTGAGAATTTIDAQQKDRVIDIISGTVTVSGVTITGGQAPAGSSPFGSNFGGGIRHRDGSLALSGITVTGNAAGNGSAGVASVSGTGTAGGLGGFGGGVYSSGLGLTITGSTITNNTAGSGGAGGNTGNGFAGQGGQGGRGGGIGMDAGYVNSTFALTDSTVTGNNAGAAGVGGTAISGTGTPGQGGDGGPAGGIYLFLPSNGLTAQISGLTVSGNHAGAGGQAGSGGTAARTGGAGGVGGGITLSGHATLTDSTISQNHAGAGGAGANGGAGGAGGAAGGLSSGDTISLTRLTVSGNESGVGGAPRGRGGNGGGLYLGGLTASVTGSTVNGNTTGAGAFSSTDSANFADAPGVGGSGGGVYAATVLTFTNSTITNNTTGAGGDYTGPNCPNWAFGQVSGAAAGMLVNQYAATLTHVTIAGNQTGPGGNGICNGTAVSQSPSPRGGLNVGGSSTTTVSNSIVANNTAGFAANCVLDFGGTIADGGGNLVGQHDSYDACPGIYADPLLGALANNGGPTQTMALPASSPAIDIGESGPCLPTDQRGTSRPQGSACDAGAYEREQAPVTPPADTGTTTPTDTAGTTNSTNPPPAGGSVADKTAPVVTLLITKQRLLKALKKSYFVGFTTTEGGIAKLRILVGKTTVATGKLSPTAPGKFKLVAKFTKKAKKALAKKRKVKLRLKFVMTDKAGNAVTKTATVTLKR